MHTVSEQVRMLYSCILTRRENSRRDKNGRMVVRDILFHTSAAAISRRNTYAFSGESAHIHSVEPNIFHLPRVEPLGRQITSPRNKCLWQRWGMFCILCETERGSHRHTSFGLQQGIDAKTNNHTRRGYNNGPGWERESVCSFSYWATCTSSLSCWAKFYK